MDISEEIKNNISNATNIYYHDFKGTYIITQQQAENIIKNSNEKENKLFNIKDSNDLILRIKQFHFIRFNK